MEDEVEEEVPTCPLCLEELDATDRAVKACQCGYQVCLWCLHTIRERLNRRCPACRTLYDEHNFKFDDFNPEQAAKEAKERKSAKKERERREKLKENERERARALVLSQQKAKSNLKHARILQKNLVYVIGLSLTLAREEVIRRPDMFGRFGRIVRALVNRSHPFNSDAPGGPSISAYVQYARDADAASAVRGMSNAVYDGREIRCAIATTKYCDALIRNAQVSDPAATYHCGNVMCMYYHSTSHSDLVLTREEVLARQLGPPPSAHLFEISGSSRRSTYASSHHRSPNVHPTSIPQTSSQVTNRAPSNRPCSNAVLSAQQPSMNKTSAHESTSSSAPHQSLLGINSTSITIPIPSSTGTSSFSSSANAVSLSPVAGTRAHSATVPSSPRQSPPSSPSADMQNLTKLNRSPAQSDTPHAPSPTSATIPSVPIPLPSSATWASVQPGHPVSRSPTRRTRPSLAENLTRSRPVAVPHRKAEAPPGFEDTSMSRSPFFVPSRPPGFGTSPSHSRTEKLAISPDGELLAKHPTSSKDLDASPHSQNAPDSSLTVLRPPGFGHSPPPRLEPVENRREEAAAVWLQEASSDAVFSSSHHRGPILPVGQTNAQLEMNQVRDEPKTRAGLEEVLANIGGTLGVSSEIHNMQPPVSMQLQSGATPHSIGQVGTDLSNSAEMSNSLFAPRPNASFNGPRDRMNSIIARMRVESYPNNLNRELSGGQGAMPPLPSHTSIPSDLNHIVPVNMTATIVRTAIALRGMRNRSRFGFAQDNSYQALKGEMRVSDNVSLGGTVSGYETNVRQGSMLGRAPRHQPSSGDVVSKETEEAIASKKPNMGNRQMRSRFNFADHGSSPPRGAVPIASNTVELSVYNTMGRSSTAPVTSIGTQFIDRVAGSKQNSRIVPEQMHGGQMTEGFIDSYHQMATEEVESSVRPVAEWAIRESIVPPMPNYDIQVSGMVRSTGTSAILVPNVTERMVTTGEHNNAMGMVGDARAVSRRPGNSIGVADENCEVRGAAEGRLASPPPGFKEATSGISPDIIAGDKTSANPGVASKVVSGGTRKETRSSSNIRSIADVFDVSSHSPSAPVVSNSPSASAITSPDDFAKNGMSDQLNVYHEIGNSAVGKSNVDESAQFTSINQNSAFEDTVNSETESAEEERKRSRAQRKRDRKARQARETVGRERKVAKESRNENKGKSHEAKKSSPTIDKSEREGKGKRKKDVGGSKINVGVEEESGNEGSKQKTVPELEKEVEAARVREAQLQDKLMEITRRLQCYDNVRS